MAVIKVVVRYAVVYLIPSHLLRKLHPIVFRAHPLLDVIILDIVPNFSARSEEGRYICEGRYHSDCPWPLFDEAWKALFNEAQFLVSYDVHVPTYRPPVSPAGDAAWVVGTTRTIRVVWPGPALLQICKWSARPWPLRRLWWHTGM